MDEQEQLCKEFGGMTDDQARKKLSEMGIEIQPGVIPYAIQKGWKRHTVNLCEASKNHYQRKIIPGEVPTTPTGINGRFPEISGVNLSYQDYRLYEMGYNHWVDDLVEGEPGNGYFVNYTWFYWEKIGEPRPYYG